MIAGRTRFYVIAGVVGAMAGALPASLAAAGVVALMAALVPDQGPQLLAFGLIAISGIAASAWCGVALMRRWYERQASRAGSR